MREALKGRNTFCSTCEHSPGNRWWFLSRPFRACTQQPGNCRDPGRWPGLRKIAPSGLLTQDAGGRQKFLAQTGSRSPRPPRPAHAPLRRTRARARSAPVSRWGRRGVRVYTEGFNSKRMEQRVINHPSVHRILVIRVACVGDDLFATPVLRALRTAFPKSFISYLTAMPAASELMRLLHSCFQARVGGTLSFF